MGTVEENVRKKRCDVPGCSRMWQENTPNRSLEVIWGVHPKIKKERAGLVILDENKYYFCPSHAKPVRDILVPTSIHFRGKADSSFDPKKGCWMTVWFYDGSMDQLLLSHQYPYEIFETFFRYFTVAVLNPLDPLVGECDMATAI
jgi:hypothetical protein